MLFSLSILYLHHEIHKLYMCCMCECVTMWNQEGPSPNWLFLPLLICITSRKITFRGTFCGTCFAWDLVQYCNWRAGIVQSRLHSHHVWHKWATATGTHSQKKCNSNMYNTNVNSICVWQHSRQRAANKPNHFSTHWAPHTLPCPLCTEYVSFKVWVDEVAALAADEFLSVQYLFKHVCLN